MEAGGRNRSLLVLLLCCGLLLPEMVNAVSSGSILQQQVTSSMQPSLPGTEVTPMFSPSSSEASSSSMTHEMTTFQITSVSTMRSSSTVSSTSIPTMTAPQSTSVPSMGGDGVSNVPPSTSSQPTTSILVQPSSPSMSSTPLSMSSSESSDSPSPASTGGTSSPSPTPSASPTSMGGITSPSPTPSATPFFTEQVIFIFIVASGTILILIMVIILMTVIACCCVVSYKRCKKRKAARMSGQAERYYDRVSGPVLSGLTVQNKTVFTQSGKELNQMELANLSLPFSSQGIPRDTRFINGAASGNQSRDGHLTSSFYAGNSSSLLLPHNPSTIGPTEDFLDIPPVEEPSLTQESVNSRIMNPVLPERSEYVHADIKARQVQREVSTKGQEEGFTQQLQTALPVSPTCSQPPQRVTTLSKKQASMVDLSMATMIKNEYFEEPGSLQVEDGDKREHVAAGRLEDALPRHEAQPQPVRRKRTSTLDLGALTSLSSPSKPQTDKQPSAKRASDNQKESLRRQTSRSMANLSYGGEADVESDGDVRNAKSPKRSKQRSSLPRASSMLEELTSIGSPPRHTVDTLMERSQEVDSDSPPEFSSVNRDPPLKSILKNSGSRQNLVTRSNVNLHASSGYEPEPYTPPVPRLPRHMLRTSTAPHDEIPQVPMGASFTQEPHRTRRSSFDVPVGYSHYRMYNSHLDPPPIKEVRDRDGFWGRPLYNYYDDGSVTPDMLASRRDKYMYY